MLRPQARSQVLEDTPDSRKPKSASGAVPEARRILGMRVDATSYAECADTALAMGLAKTGGMVCVATVHMVMESFDDPAFRRCVNAADRVTPDGVPLVWALRRRGISDATRVYGPELMSEICARAEARELTIGLYGGTPRVLTALCARLHKRYPRLQIRFAFAPPFAPLGSEEDARITEAMAASGAHVVFVGLGCPKQERWMADHRARLPCALVGVGAAFDFLAGEKAQAPAWMQRCGLEWLFRLIHEPRRLARRYLVGNPRFIFQSVFGRNVE